MSITWKLFLIATIFYAATADYMSDFQSIADEYGKKRCANYGGARFVDLYAKHPDMRQYQQYKIDAYVNRLSYEGNPTTISSPDSIVSQWFDNNANTAQKTSFSFKESVTATFTWSLTEGIKLGVALEGKIGLPLVAEGKVSVSTEVTFSSTQTKTETKTKEFTKAIDVNVSPLKSYQILFVIKTEKYNMDYSADIVIRGHVAIWCNNKLDGHWLWFIPVSWIIGDLNPKNYYRTADGNVMYKAKGRFEGQQGVDSYVRVNEFPLRPQRLLSPSASDESPFNDTTPISSVEYHDDLFNSDSPVPLSPSVGEQPETNTDTTSSSGSNWKLAFSLTLIGSALFLGVAGYTVAKRKRASQLPSDLNDPLQLDS